MCSEYEPDRAVREEQAQEEIRRLFERYRAAARRAVTSRGAVGVETPDTVEEQEPALVAR